ncbi:MAG TPA: hypothetical protein VGL11_12555 [Candidatus Binatia bacterium]|jgi:hypothetical protein
MNIGAGNVLVLIFVVSFVIDRAVTGLLFMLSYDASWNRLARFFPDPRVMEDTRSRVRAEGKQKLAYFAFSILFAIVVLVYFGEIRILKALGYETRLDFIVTAVALIAGADVLAKVLEMSGMGGKEAATPRPIEITGSLVIEEGKGKRAEEKTVQS